MTQVTLNETPSDIATAKPQFECIDSAGRKITLKKPGILAQYRIMETVGAEAAANSTYMMMVLPVLYVASIDGDPVDFPVRKAQLEALIQRLDDHGLEAVMKSVSEHFGKAKAEAAVRGLLYGTGETFASLKG